MTNGDGVRELQKTMSILRGDGGCLWDREQTHESLVTFLIEETAELVDAIEAGTRDDLVEELGDVLYQVLFHADILSDDPDTPVTLDDVARRTSEKMRRRHPHVFGDVTVSDVSEIRDNWVKTKQAEKGQDRLTVDQVPHSLQPLARAQALLLRAKRNEVDPGIHGLAPDTEEELGEALLSLVEGALEKGLDPDRAMRLALRRLEEAITRRETGRQ